jgi:hypothetical protein
MKLIRPSYLPAYICRRISIIPIGEIDVYRLKGKKASNQQTGRFALTRELCHVQAK